ncbi:hypothetical protein J2S18_001588 [Eubacterium multiforme]|uniref:Uncharacterized protein n=1 Tax=Eubacterium multiforme TaxID=83339 RepID=A0ABT9UTM2_9FIRM|nr:hypothetical protein [Eubacterium multiforme]
MHNEANAILKTNKNKEKSKEKNNDYELEM